MTTVHIHEHIRTQGEEVDDDDDERRRRRSTRSRRMRSTMTRSRRRRSTCWHEGEEEEVDEHDHQLIPGELAKETDAPLSGEPMGGGNTALHNIS